MFSNLHSKTTKIILSSLNLKKICRFTTRDRIVVSTLRCGRNNPGSNPDHGYLFSTMRELIFSEVVERRYISSYDQIFCQPTLKCQNAGAHSAISESRGVI